MKRVFFITGLPRSRTAWLSNLMTCGNAFCYHEVCRRWLTCPPPGGGIARALHNAFEAAGLPIVGTADSAFPAYAPAALNAFPEASVVIIQRDPDEAYESCKRFLAGQPEKDRMAADFHDLQEKLEDLALTLPGKHLRIAYEDLATMEACRVLWTYCTGGELFSERRWAELDKLNIQVKPDVAIAEALSRKPSAPKEENGAAPPRRPDGAQSARLDAEYDGLLREMCAKQPAAHEWLQSLWDVLLTWDHIEDGDPIDKPTANRAFEALTLYWPQNPFFQEHKQRLLPVMFNAVSAWRHANAGGPACKGWDFYTEVPTTVAAILGGMAAVNHYMPRLRTLSEERRAADDQEDN